MGLASSCRFSPHMPRPLTPTVPPKSYQDDFFVLASVALKNVADCFDSLTMLTWLRGCAYPLWPMWFSVYASCILLCSRLPQSKPLATLRRIRNTRYGWLVKPYEISILGFLPSGTFTLKEATSFACRTNASFTGCHKRRVFCGFLFSQKACRLWQPACKLLLCFFMLIN